MSHPRANPSFSRAPAVWLALCLLAIGGLVGCERPAEGGDEGAVQGAESLESHGRVQAPGPLGEPPVEAAPEGDDEEEDLEMALLRGFTRAVERRDIDAVSSWLSPELGGELRRLHLADPDEFWARGAVWLDRAASGMELKARQSSDGMERWRGLVRFGDGFEESVVFGRFEGRVLLADL